MSLCLLLLQTLCQSGWVFSVSAFQVQSYTIQTSRKRPRQQKLIPLNNRIRAVHLQNVNHTYDNFCFRLKATPSEKFRIFEKIKAHVAHVA